MKTLKQLYFCTTLIIASLLFFSCSKDNDPKPEEENIPLEVGGTITGDVNGEKVNYADVRIAVYGLSNSVGIIGHQQVEEHRRDRVRVVVPLTPTTGTFDHNETPFFVHYEAIMGNSEDGAGFNRNASGKITITDYKSIGTDGDETYYYVKGTFERSGMNNFNSETVDIREGEFEFVYKY